MSHEEPRIVGALIDLFKEYGVTTLMQIGAEDGYEAEEIRKVIGCTAICIEGNTAAAPISPGLIWHYSLIGATNCVIPFYANKDIDISTVYRRADSKETLHHVRQRRLDTFCDYWGYAPDGLIIDVEGATMDVLEGASRVLDGVKVVYAEVSTGAIREGIRPLSLIESILAAHGLTHRDGLPTYCGGMQSNETWVRK